MNVVVLAMVALLLGGCATAFVHPTGSETITCHLVAPAIEVCLWPACPLVMLGGMALGWAALGLSVLVVAANVAFYEWCVTNAETGGYIAVKGR
jgi:hypothetical protein